MNLTEEQYKIRIETLGYQLLSLKWKMPKVTSRALSRAVAEKRWKAALRLMASITTCNNRLSFHSLHAIFAQLADDNLAGPSLRDVYERVKTVEDDLWWKKEFLYLIISYLGNANTK